MYLARIRTLCSSFLVASFALATPFEALAKDDLGLELNKLAPAGASCQAYFLIAEKAGKPLQSLKADLIIFGKDGAIAKRLIAEMGPVRANKTSVKIFAIDVACADIAGVLLNEVASCARCDARGLPRPARAVVAPRYPFL